MRVHPGRLSWLVAVCLLVVSPAVLGAVGADVPRLVLPAPDVAAYQAEDAAREATGRPVPLRFAAPIEAAVSTASSGHWIVDADGSEVWRLRVASPGARSLNFHFARFDLPAGGVMRLLDGEGQPSQRALHTDDRNHQGGLWTPIVPGDEVILEVRVPAGRRDRTHLLLSSVQHGYRDLAAPTKQGFCNIDVVCSEADPYRDQVRAAARYTITGSFLCSGQLVNNTAEDGTPYFLTASHCFHDPESDAATVVVYWNFESPTCGMLSGGSLLDNQSGATMVAYWGSATSESVLASTADLALLRLDAAPNASANAYLAGWDATGEVPAAGVFGIHHPSGDEKAISFDDDPGTITPYASDLPDPNGRYYRIGAWDVGTTEGGSSGSCIYARDTARCIGVLTGGFASCFATDQPDWYGRLAKQWEGGGTPDTRLRDWLDPLATGALTLGGRDAANGGNGDASRWLVPAAASTPGVGTSNWKSQLQVVNSSNAALSATVHFVASGAAWPGETLSGPHTLAPREVLWLDDPLLPLNPTSGLVWVGLSAPGAQVSTRTFNLADGGVTFGQGIPGILLDDAAASTELVLPLASSIPGRFRVNLGLVQTSAGSWTARVSIYDAGGTLRASGTYTQSAGFRQINNVFANLGLGSTSIEGGWIRVELVSGAPEFWTAYLSVIDDGTDDPTYVAGISN